MSHKGHRSTLKQTNKPYKTKFATKGEAKRKTKGRVPGEERKGPKQQSKDGSKDRRKHQARQLREEKRHNLVQSRRNAAQGATPPKVVAFIDLSAAADSKYLISKLSTLPEIHRADETFATQTATDPKNVVLLDQSVNILSTTWKQRLALHATSNDTLSLLDITKVADILVFVMSGEDNGEDLIDQRARELIRLVSVQGFGLLYGVIQGGQTSHHSKLRKFLEHELLKQFGVESKIVLLPGPNSEESTIVDVAETIENEQDIATTKNFLRLLCQANPPPAPIDRHQKRPYVLAESIEFVPGASDQVGDLVVQGYVRGTPLSIHQLVHVPECDDFAIRSIVQAVDPCPVPGQARKVSTTTASSSSSSAEAEGDVAMGGADQTRKITPGTVLLTPSEKFQESLIQENIPDSLEGEQNISDDEMEAERLEIIRAAGRQKVLRRVPKGTTAYHASWIVDSDDDEDFDHDDDEEEEEDEDMMGLSSSKKPKKEGTEDEEDVSIKKMRSTIQYDGEEHDSDEEEEDEGDEVGEEEYELMDVDAEKERIRKEALMKRLAEMEQEDFDFPDEVETPFDESARERFAKYRGLKSFRTSPWDPKENLPRDYARIFQFQNFNHTQRRVLKKAVDPEAADVVPVGTFVSVVLADIPREIATFLAERHASAAHPVILFGLLQHERKISVLHATLKRSITYIDPIRSKEEMIMQIGFRRIRCCPVYSENSLKSNKFKLQKFFPHGDPSVASVYAPITYLPANVMMFRLDHSGKLDLVAEGSLHSVNPNRLIIKKIVLTGSIYKIYRRKCVVRGMFYDPVDIKWFKPVELRTRRGKTGHILEPVGTHGYMKCIFDNQLQHNDTVLMNLYKRAFPVWRSQYYSYNNLGPSLQLEDDLESKIIESDLRSTRSRRSTRSKRSTVSVRSSRSRRSAK